MKEADQMYLMTDQQRLRVAEAQFEQIRATSPELRPSQVAERISEQTGVGSDAARLVVMARFKDR